MTPFDAFHAATAATQRDGLSSEKDSEDIAVERLAVEPTDED